MSSYSTHAEILCLGITAWNAWRDKNPSIVPDLQGVVLALSEDSLNGGSVNLREARLQSSVLRFATLPAADLEAADMSGADLMHARLDHANLSAVNLRNSRLDHAHLSGATLTEVNLCGAKLRFANLSAADLQAADMSDADLMHARLNQTNLSAANFTNARLDYADFAGAKLAKVNLCGASLQHAKNLTESQIKESTGDPSTILPPHLQGSVSWSPTISPTFEHYEFGPRPSDRQSRWSSAKFVQRATSGIIAFLTSVALIIILFVWPHTNEFAPLDRLGEDSGQGLWATAPEALMKTTSERRITTDTTSGASTASQIGNALEHHVSPDLGATVLGPASTPGVSEEEYEAPESTALVFAVTPPTAWPHAIDPGLPSEPSELSTLAYTGAGQTALASGPETPPTLPARNPARGQDIETAHTISPSSAEIPPKPFRNPLR